MVSGFPSVWLIFQINLLDCFLIIILPNKTWKKFSRAVKTKQNGRKKQWNKFWSFILIKVSNQNYIHACFTRHKVATKFHKECMSWSRDQNNRFWNTWQNLRHYQIFTRHLKNPLDIMSSNPANSSTTNNLG